jgi:quinol monooxygenase YgiN
MLESGPIIYVDNSEVREGRLEELKDAIKELAELVKAKEARILGYNVYFTDGGKRMTVIHIHRDSASLEFHMQVAGPAFAKFVDYVKMLTIDVYGDINEGLLDQLRKKAQMLGNGRVTAHEFHAGFARFLP